MENLEILENTGNVLNQEPVQEIQNEISHEANHDDCLINVETLELTEKGKQSKNRRKSKKELEAEALHFAAAEKEREIQEAEKARLDKIAEDFGRPTPPQSTATISGIKITLPAPTEIFGKKAAEGKPSVMRQGTELIIKKLADIGPTGTNMCSLRKENSKRIFYTPIENLTKHGIAIN